MTSKVVVSIFLSRVFLASAALRHLNARNERRRFVALAVRITPTPTCTLTTVQAGVCSLLNTAIKVASPRQTLASQRAVQGATQLEISHELPCKVFNRAQRRALEWPYDRQPRSQLLRRPPIVSPERRVS
jgi:hypothetical protein